METKKTIFAILVIAAFILSVFPGALAESGEGKVRAMHEDGDDDDNNESDDSGRFENETEDSKDYNDSDREQKIEQNMELIKERTRKQIEKRFEISTKLAEKLPEWKRERMQDMIEKRKEQAEKLTELQEEKLQAFLEFPREKQLEILNSTNISKEMLKYKLEKIRKEDLGKARKIAKEHMEKAQKQYEKAKENYDKWKDLLKTREEKFREAKEEYKACKNNSTCENISQQMILRSKEYLNNSVNLAIDHLTKIRAKVDSNEGISENESARILADIDGQVSKLNALLAKINSADTKEDIQAVVKEMKQIWNEVQYAARRHGERLVHEGVGEIVIRAEHLEDQLQCAISNMSQQNLSTLGIEEKMANFSFKVHEARTKFNNATAIFKEIGNSSTNESKAKLETAKALVKSAHQDLKQAHTLLTQITKMIRDNGGMILCSQKDKDLEEDEMYIIRDDQTLETIA